MQNLPFYALFSPKRCPTAEKGKTKGLFFHIFQQHFTLAPHPATQAEGSLPKGDKEDLGTMPSPARVAARLPCRRKLQAIAVPPRGFRQLPTPCGKILPPPIAPRPSPGAICPDTIPVSGHARNMMSKKNDSYQFDTFLTLIYLFHNYNLPIFAIYYAIPQTTPNQYL